MATIQDVTKAAGVSAMTVSNVINDHPNVRRATREKALEAMARLDYRVNLAARNLRKGRTGTIRPAIPGVNSAYGELAAAIVAAAARYDLRVSIEQTGALRENELAALSLSRNRLYDGLLLSPVGMGSADAEWLNVDYPVVILGELIIGAGGPRRHAQCRRVEGGHAPSDRSGLPAHRDPVRAGG
ncbi:LacI family transcriptional regulator [Streptomyces sp. NBC_00285]|uniref:LacI family DNA-binding transcriptional regulator n=1 Tax=Streptomyces sp. NBC_00285 TaxID=2975700 RepID=UPI002E28D9C6|nr:LacI family DNA-binding transcriptional regulator [Streptomyces sp. NBC_00285]